MAVAAVIALRTLAPAAPPGVPVLVTTHDLAAGRVLAEGDVRRSFWPPGTAPRATLTDAATAVGRTLSGPLTAGSPVTSAALLGPGLLTGQDPALLAVPVTVTGPGLPDLVRAGDRVDVLSAASGTVVVANALVLGREAGSSGASAGSALDSSAAGAGAGATLVLALAGSQAAGVIRAQAVGPLGLALRGRTP